MKLPYGYVLDGKEIAIHAERVNNVRSIFECYLAGASLGKIVDMLFATERLKVEAAQRAAERNCHVYRLLRKNL